MSFSWNNVSKPIIALSPMADMTDSPFCMTVKDVSSPVMFREMVSSEALVRENDKTLEMAAFDEIERPLIQQIFGADPEAMAKAARIIWDTHKPDGIDINMGCPVYKLTSNFNGASLMRDSELAHKIVVAVKAAVPCPVSVKIRAGWSDPNECVEFAKMLELAGADLITVHGRTKEQAYSGFADWHVIKLVKEAVSIPVLANGDIFSGKDAQRCLKVTGADGILVARGALGNPWMFQEIEEIVETGTVQSRPTYKQHFELVLAHAKRHVEQYGDHGIVTFRKHLSWYTKGMTGAKEFRSQLVRIATIDELEDLVKPYLDDEREMDFVRLTSLQPNKYENE